MPKVTSRRAPSRAKPKAATGRPRSAARTRSSTDYGRRRSWQMKMGAWAHAHMRQLAYNPQTSQRLAIASIALIGFVFIAILAVSGQLGQARANVDNASANIARSMGFGVEHVTIQAGEGRSLTQLQLDEAQQISAIPHDAVMFTLSPETLRDRFLSLAWVEGVSVRKLWPNSVEITVTPREVSARWQYRGNIYLVDPGGKVVRTAYGDDGADLPLLMGRGAPAKASQLFTELKARPILASRTKSVERVDDRRWNLHLDNQAVVLLPANEMGRALDLIEVMQMQKSVLDLGYGRYDLRAPNVMLIRRTIGAGAQIQPAKTGDISAMPNGHQNV